jgi:hypothetical protein
MDREVSDELADRMPIVPHSTAGGDCCGCIVAAVVGSNMELRCNEYSAAVGVVHIDILKALARAGIRFGDLPALRRGKHVPRLHRSFGVRLRRVRKSGGTTRLWNRTRRN